MTVFGTAVTLVSAYFALRNVDFAEVWSTLESSDYWWLAPALVVMALAVFVRVLRWRYLFVAERRPGLWPLSEALLIGSFFNTVLPARAGDLARVGAINLRAGTSKAEALATVVVERAFDVLALLLLLFVALPWLPEVNWVRTAAIVAVVLGIGFAACVFVLTVYGERPLHVLLKPFARLRFLRAERLERAAVNLSAGLMGLRRAHLGGASFVLTLVSWLLFALSFWLVMLCFDFGLPLGAGLLVVDRDRLLARAPRCTGRPRRLRGGHGRCSRCLRRSQVGGAVVRARPPRLHDRAVPGRGRRRAEHPRRPARPPAALGRTRRGSGIGRHGPWAAL